MHHLEHGAHMVLNVILHIDAITTNEGRVVWLMWKYCDNASGQLLSAQTRIIQPEGFTISTEEELQCRTTHAIATEDGTPMDAILMEMLDELSMHIAAANQEHDCTVSLHADRSALTSLMADISMLGMSKTCTITPI